jgi:NAD(P)H dehydrogenase (quinone)
MNVLYVYAHPEPRSFNGALRDAAMVTLARSGHQVKVSNLYVMKFKAVLDPQDFRIRADPYHFNPAEEQIHGFRTGSLAPDIREEIEKITWADILIFQFPIWWSFLPAILKGWIDRVFVQGFVVDIEHGRVYDRGLLRGKRGLIVATCGSTAEMYSREGIHGDLIGHLSTVTHTVFEFTGMEALPPFIVYNVPALNREERERQIERYRTFLESL